MRKHLVWILGVALAIGVASIAIGANVHSIKAQVTPAKQDKDRYGPASFNFTTASTCQGDGCTLNAANRVRVYIDNDLKLTTRGLAQCPASRLADTTTAQAKARCGNALVGAGRTVAFIGGNPNAVVSGTGTTFNGPPKGGKPTLIVHSRIDAIGSTVVLTGVYTNGTGDFGKVLDVHVPTLPFGTALASFQNKIHRSYTFKGQRLNYLAARCFDKNRTWNFKGRDDYGGGEPPQTATATQKCTVRR